ncbi:hypothetical protein F0562_032096 [Nyssa sinensis]|uniref:Retrotransposon gag domain-containing protein n=1 Tax=Nyssa sinensis TaxID=561372 RepID=A0A5J5AU36_9ASTE|nr:hypothetical protein F0562_032096 [Nyssa sinensis]
MGWPCVRPKRWVCATEWSISGAAASGLARSGLLAWPKTSGKDGARKLKVPEPKAFNGVWCAKDLENFLWDMEQYFTIAHILDGEQVTMTIMYLAGDAKLWWRTCVVDERRSKIRVWVDLKKELKE